jgi:hypothetical protein
VDQGRPARLAPAVRRQQPRQGSRAVRCLRQAVFDDLFGQGIALVPRHKFIYLADQTNMCPSVLRTWLEHWRDYVDNQNDDLEYLLVGDSVVLWRKGWQQKNGGPIALSDALAAAA